MRLVYRGKTKDVYEDGPPYLIFYFKDSLLGGENGREDTGGNSVIGGVRTGKGGSAVLRQTEFFFNLLGRNGVRTHFVERIDDRRARFLKAERIPLEVVYRFKAYGSFLRRYRGWVEPPLRELRMVEFTLKDDSLGDPPHNRGSRVAARHSERGRAGENEGDNEAGCRDPEGVFPGEGGARSGGLQAGVRQAERGGASGYRRAQRRHHARYEGRKAPDSGRATGGGG